MQVSGHLHCLSCSANLHDALYGVLDALADLLTTRLGLPLHPVLAAAHGHNEPAVLFARRPRAGGALGRSNTHGGTSELPLAMASPFTSAGPPLGSPGTGHVLMRKSTSYSMLAGGGGGTWSSSGAVGAGPGPGVHGSVQARGLMGTPQQQQLRAPAHNGEQQQQQQRGSSLSLTSVQLCVPAEVPDAGTPDGGQPSVRAVRTALTHTLLQQVLRWVCCTGSLRNAHSTRYKQNVATSGALQAAFCGRLALQQSTVAEVQPADASPLLTIRAALPMRADACLDRVASLRLPCHASSRTASAAATVSSDLQSTCGTLNLDGRQQASPTPQAQVN